MVDAAVAFFHVWRCSTFPRDLFETGNATIMGDAEERKSVRLAITTFQLPESSGDPDDGSWDRTFAAAASVGALEANIAWLLASATVNSNASTVGFFGLILCAPISLFGALCGLLVNVLLSRHRWSFHITCLSICLTLFEMLLKSLSGID